MHSQSPNKVKTKDLVASLNEVAKGLEAEDKKAFELAATTKAECKTTQRELKLALSKGKHTAEMATNDYQKTNANVEALKASLAELKGQIDSTNTNLDDLNKQLKKLRQDKGVLKKGAAKALRQVEAVIHKAQLLEDNHDKSPSALEKKVNSLEELSKSLSFLQEEESSEEESEEDKEAESQDQKHAPVMMLKADKQAVVRASAATQRGFNEEEKKLIDLIEVDRKKLADLEDNLQDLQPAIADKLKQAMEINRTLAAAQQGMKRDAELMEAEDKKCKTIQDGLAKQKKTRGLATNDVKMASGLIEHMDAALFLSKDLEGLKKVTPAAPAFLQVSQDDSHRQQLVAAATEPVYRALSLLQEGDGMGVEELVENYDSASSGNEGPFDNVLKMISGLIASLKAQANEEVNQHQFCQDSLSKNRRDRIAKKNNIDSLASTVRWSKMAIVRLDDDLSYLKGEMDRLTKVQATEKQELANEKKRVGVELKEHKLANEVVTKVIVILNQLCSLDGAAMIQDGTSLIQKQRQTSKVGSRFAQCKEAADLLKSGVKGLAELDKETKEYMDAYTKVSEKIASDAKDAYTSRDTEMKSTKSARAQRASELATASKDAKEAKKDLVLIQKAKQELEHSCNHVETREEKMARRKDEIDALKEALNVLNGEAVPA